MAADLLTLPQSQSGTLMPETKTESFGITGSDVNFADITASGNITASGDILTTNINVGTPTSNNWGENLQGSYFNNFNATTDVSEILRFVAGLLSSSAASPTANTKTYGLILVDQYAVFDPLQPTVYFP